MLEEIQKLDLSNVIILIQFLIPGYLIVFSRSVFVFRQKTLFKDDIALFIALSVLYGFIFIPILSFMPTHLNPFSKWFVWLLVLILVPIVLGIVLGVGAQRDWGRDALARIGLQPISPFPTSWDQRFSQLSSPCYVIVTWQDGSQIAGFFGENSYAASSGDQRDIFIEKVWTIDENETWNPLNDSDGVLISAKEIKAIEFLRHGDNVDVQQNTTVQPKTNAAAPL